MKNTRRRIPDQRTYPGRVDYATDYILGSRRRWGIKPGTGGVARDPHGLHIFTRPEMRQEPTPPRRHAARPQRLRTPPAPRRRSRIDPAEGRHLISERRLASPFRTRGFHIRGSQPRSRIKTSVRHWSGFPGGGG